MKEPNSLNNETDSLTILLPVFNEEQNIEFIIKDILDYIPLRVKDFEIVAINDGSSDKSQSILERINLENPRLKIVTHKKNQGYGAAIRTGIKESSKKWILIMDADRQLRISEFGVFWQKRNEYDFILGFRRERHDNLYRFLLGRSGNLLTCLILKRAVKDINCGFKFYRGKDIKALPLMTEGGLISFEILNGLLRHGKTNFLQYPVEHYPRKYGVQTGGQLRIIKGLIIESIKMFSR